MHGKNDDLSYSVTNVETSNSTLVSDLIPLNLKYKGYAYTKRNFQAL